MREEDYTPKKGEPKLGTFVYSSWDSGDDAAIRIAFLEWHERIDSFYMSPEQAENLANIILDVVKDYKNGIQTNFKS
jgi:hypothetical protein